MSGADWLLTIPALEKLLRPALADPLDTDIGAALGDRT